MSLPLSLLCDNWFVAATSKEVRRQPVSRVLLGLPLVVFRSGSAVSALVDRCPHRNVALSYGSVEKGLIQCSYHGWKFDGAGTCCEIPGLAEAATACSARNVTAFPTHECDGLIWVYISERQFHNAFLATKSDGSTEASMRADQLPPPVPLHYRSPATSEFDSFVWTTSAKCNFVDGLENLLDASHPAYVHRWLVRSGTTRRPVDLLVCRDSEKAEAIYVENSRPEALIPRLLEGVRSESIGRYFPPTTAQLEYRGPKGTRFLLTAMISPIDERSCQVYAIISTPRTIVPAFAKTVFLKMIFDAVLKQDLQILLRQRENIDRFGAPKFVSTPLDVMRPHILYFLQREKSAAVLPFEKALSLEL